MRTIRSCKPNCPCASRVRFNPLANRVTLAKSAPNKQDACVIDLEKEGGDAMCTPEGEVVPLNNVGDFCSIDASAQPVISRTVGEMEQEFLEAMTSLYYDGKPTLSDAEFDVLKSELLWSGSKVAVLDAEEQLFLEASMGYAKGKPIMSDEEFDALKGQLKQKNSVVTAQGPRCSIRSKKVYSDCEPDYVRTVALNLPAALASLGVVFALDYLSDYDITKAMELPPPFGPLVLGAIVLPALYMTSAGITNVVFKDAVILKGPCPNCGTDNFTYFGEILTVSGNRGVNQIECCSCKADLGFDENKRIVVVNETPEEKEKKAAAAAAKKAAAAAKRKAVAAPKSA